MANSRNLRPRRTEVTRTWHKIVQPFFDQQKATFNLDTEMIGKLESRLTEINKGRMKGKLTMDHMLSHMLIEMGDNPPKIGTKDTKPKILEVTLYDLASENLEAAT